MGIFNKKKQLEEWTETTAPKKKTITLVTSIKLHLPPETSYGNIVTCLSNEVNKELLVNTDSDKECIKQEVLKRLEIMYEEFCEALDNNTTYFSNTFWENVKSQKQE